MTNSEEFYKKRIQELERKQRQLLYQLELKKTTLKEITDAVKRLPPFEKWTPPKPPSRRRNKPVSACFVWSDWHIGEVVRAAEVRQGNEYNYQIAEARFFEIIDNFLNWITTHRNAYRIPKLIVFGLGDYISGNIHDELLINNEFSAAEQTAKAGFLLAEGLRRLSARFNQVIFHGLTADNHGRFYRKPVYKERGRHNFNYIIYELAKEALRNSKKIQIKIYDGISEIIQIDKFRFLVTHGDNIRSWMGIPWYGIQRMKRMESEKCMYYSDAFEYMVLGHWHQSGYIPGNILLNGSLSGTTEYDTAAGRHSKPGQIAFLLHPKKGVFNFLTLQTTL